VDSPIEKNLLLAARNLPKVQLALADDLHTYQVLWPSKLLMTRGAFEKIAARLEE
jgi:ribosomal protein L4